MAQWHRVSEVTLHRWRAGCAAVNLDAVKQLKDRKKHNAELQRLVADRQLDIEIFKEIAKCEI